MTAEQLIRELEAEVDGGTAEGLEKLVHDILEEAGEQRTDFHELDSYTLGQIDEHFFECVQCGWTMPIDSLSESEDDDDKYCKDCCED